MGIMFGNAALFAILAWYFDNVISSNRGRSKSVFFPILDLLDFFGCYKSEKVQQNMLTNFKRNMLGEEESAVKERNRVYKNSE